MSGNKPDDLRKPGLDEQGRTVKDASGKPGDSGASHSGAHAAEKGEEVKSRSADPGQSSYGGFKNEDPRHQTQDLDPSDSGKASDSKTTGEGKKA